MYIIYILCCKVNNNYNILCYLAKRKGCRIYIRQPSISNLFFHDFQNFHGAGLYADTAGDTLAGRSFLGHYHNLHGARFHALAAGGAQFLVNHVHTGLGVLSDCTGLTDLGALTALDTVHGLGCAILIHNADTGQILMELLIESLGTGGNAL